MLAKTEGDRIVWYHLLKRKELPVQNIIWAYLQQEDVSAKVCCGTSNFIIGRLIVVCKDGTREVFQYDGMEKPRALLQELSLKNPEIAIGFTPENKERFCDIES